MKDYSYKQTEVKTLRILLDFEKFKNNADVDKAFNILQLKEKKKAQYILNAIRYYETLADPFSPMRKICFDLQCIDFIKTRYNLKTEEDISNLLECSPDEYRKITAKIPEHKTPAKMLCGFTIGDKEAEEMHKRLFTLPVNDRIFLITSAVLAYVYDGYDPRAKAILAYRFLQTLIDTYRKENKSILVSNLYQMMRISTKIQSNAPKKETSDISRELLSLFVDEDEIEYFLK